MSRKAYVVGNLNIDAVMGFFTSWPAVGTEVENDFFDMRCAGAAGNTALALKKLGFEVHVISSLGEDTLGRIFFEEFEKYGIDLSRCKISKKRTGISFGVIFENRERTFFSFSGALNDVNEEFLEKGLYDVENSYVFLCGFNVIQAFKSDEFVWLIRKVKTKGNSIIFDPGWPPEGWKEEIREKALRLAIFSDWFIPNRAEALAISKMKSVEESLKFFVRKGVKNCVVKMGSNGSKAVISSEKMYAKAYTFGQVIDTVGAGDLFNAALVKGLDIGWEKKKMLNFANFYASLGITRLGERRYPDFKEALLEFEKALRQGGNEHGRS